MFKKILNINNMGVFNDFDWDNSVRDKDNNIVEFKKVNILYGRNYSGKTTLSRIFRSLEKNELPIKYENPQFSVQDDNKSIAQGSLDQNDKTVRVFNKDFVKENLRFIIDDDGEINSFAVLGEENTQIQEKIENIKSELGSENEETGFYEKLKFAKEQSTQSKEEEDEAEYSLTEKLRNKAREIKNKNSQFGDVNYDLTKIKKDIENIRALPYSKTDIDEVSQLQNLLKDESNEKIPDLEDFDLKFEMLAEKAKTLIEQKISISEPIQELLNDNLLQKWAREGRDLHKDKRESCGFCGNPLPSNLWNKLDKHFNEDSEFLRKEIENLVRKIENEEQHIPNLVKINQQDFYSKFKTTVNEIEYRFNQKSTAYLETLQSLKSQLTTRKNDITRNLTFQMPKSITSELLKIQDEWNNVIEKNNMYSSKLSSTQEKAKNTLRLNEAHKFISDIGYDAERKKIEQLKDKARKNKKIYEEKQKLVVHKKEELTKLNNQLGDETKGADRVNELLGSYFGYNFLSLAAIKSEDASPSTHKFEIRRGEEKAYNLSEGECSLIAFCYFIARLGDSDTKDSKPIIWIDDPVSSLDSNHIFFIFGLIYNKIVESEQYEQLFISTHDLDFLKYLKRISTDHTGSGNNKKKIREFFLVERQDDISTISIMPNYIKQHVTEFNYLFHQIYKCAYSDVNDKNYHCFYSFGNNARKFLEIFLYYRYPNMDEFKKKLTKFFGKDQIPQIITGRINNEYSHLSGSLERGSHPVEVPEMQKTAKLILQKIANCNQDQYQALLESIGESETTHEDK